MSYNGEENESVWRNEMAKAWRKRRRGRQREMAAAETAHGAKYQHISSTKKNGSAMAA
jgi:hypothetical protein